MNRKIKSHYDIVSQTFAQLNYDAYLIHCHWMEYAIALAQTAGDLGEIPVAAVIINEQGSLIAEASNHKERNQDATAHAEILAIRTASKIKQSCYLKNCNSLCHLRTLSDVRGGNHTIAFGFAGIRCRRTKNRGDSYCNESSR